MPALKDCNGILLSIIIPVYNVEKYLSNCLDSLLDNIAESYKDLVEVLVINDGSTDGSQQLIDFYVNKYNFVNCYIKSNGGLSDARNYGIEIAKGKYVSFIDSDDVVHPDFINTVIGIIRNEDFDILSFEYKKFYGDRISKPFSSDVILQKVNKDLIEVKSDFYLTSALFAWNKIYSIKCFNHNKFIKGLHYEDVALIPLLIDSAKIILHLNIPLYGYRQRRGSITSLKDDKYLDLLEGLKFIKENAHTFFIYKLIISQFFTLCLLTLRLPINRYLKNMNEICDFYMKEFMFDRVKVPFTIRNAPYILLRLSRENLVYLLLLFKLPVMAHLWLKTILSTFR